MGGKKVKTQRLKTKRTADTEVVRKGRSAFALPTTAGLPTAIAFWKPEQKTNTLSVLWKELDPRRNVAADTFKAPVL